MAAMSVARLLAILYRGGANLSVEDGELVVDAPKGLLTPEVVDAIRERYDDLVFIIDRTPIRGMPVPLEAFREAKALDGRRGGVA
jgi:hypothetical protein